MKQEHRKKITCPHCKKEIIGKDYRVTFICEGSEENYETSVIWGDCFTPEDAVDTAKYFDEGFVKLVKVEELRKEEQ